ncbi:hypothetical protein FB451DRAFT_1212866 [Mycena latifolia]|nr:hypothetical protein FB451DRAFT_1212866 [Mycena latifolia]
MLHEEGPDWQGIALSSEKRAGNNTSSAVTVLWNRNLTTGAGNYAPGGGYRSNTPPALNFTANSAVSIHVEESTRGMEVNMTGGCRRRCPNSAERVRMHRRCPIPRLESARYAATSCKRKSGRTVFVSDGGVVVERRLRPLAILSVRRMYFVLRHLTRKTSSTCKENGATERSGT